MYSTREALQFISEPSRYHTCHFSKFLSPSTRQKFEKARVEYLVSLYETNELCRQYSEACYRAVPRFKVDGTFYRCIHPYHRSPHNFVPSSLPMTFMKQEISSIPQFQDKVGVHLSAEGSKIVVEEMCEDAEWEPSLQGDSMGLSDKPSFAYVSYMGILPQN
ncbi:hypothetical protein CK203_038085 [Vitis vinifera]|uniref:Uncharacterized protein n=1 Tax=Vitis vinifera TaxID=29760 RepID=A0A438HA17_VITVI|nr:hypothetical protein CK203_038085 [Vitis vinifera]